MKATKLLSVTLTITTTILLSGLALLTPLFIVHDAQGAQTVEDGDLIRVSNDYKVWIVKRVGDKKFKRHLFGPQVINAYGHLKAGYPGNVKVVDPSVVDGYATSYLIRQYGDTKVHMLENIVPGVSATKRWVQTLADFNTAGYDWDGVSVVNVTEMALYTAGTDISDAVSIPEKGLTVDELNIASVSITPDIESAKVEWGTTQPTESKIFVYANNSPSKVFVSDKFSATHSVNVTDLTSNTNYSYDITALNETGFSKKSGGFSTLPHFVAEISLDKDAVKNDGVDFVTIKVMAKLSNGDVLSNKLLKLKTYISGDNKISDPFEDTKMSDNQGVVIFKTKPTNYYNYCWGMTMIINIIDEGSGEILHSNSIEITNIKSTPIPLPAGFCA